MTTYEIIASVCLISLTVAALTVAVLAVMDFMKEKKNGK